MEASVGVHRNSCCFACQPSPIVGEHICSAAAMSATLQWHQAFQHGLRGISTGILQAFLDRGSGGIQPHGLNSYPVRSLSLVQTAIVGLISLNQESQANYILLSVLSLWRTLVCAQDGEDPVWSI